MTCQDQARLQSSSSSDEDICSAGEGAVLRALGVRRLSMCLGRSSHDPQAPQVEVSHGSSSNLKRAGRKVQEISLCLS